MKTILSLCAAMLAVTALGAQIQQTQEIRVAPATATAGAPFVIGGNPMAVGTGVVFGTVTEAESNRPVAGAIVSINLAGSQIRVMTDNQGRFGFRDLPAGGFRVTTTRPGWVDGAYGRTRPAGPTLALALADGERVSGVVIPMWRFASIAGNVIDESGDPLVNVPVRVMRKAMYGGKPRLSVAQMDTTDDRGQYRVGSLEPGEYVVVVPTQQQSELPIMLNGDMTRDVVAVRQRVEAVAASAGAGGAFFVASSGAGPNAGVGEDGRPLAFPTVFYPNVQASTRATVIAVASGEERTSVDFQLRGVPTARISGTVMGPDGPGAGAQLTLVPSESEDNATTFETFTTSADGQGRYTFPAVTPGQYTLRAMRQPRPGGMPAEARTAMVSPDGAVMVRSVMAVGGVQLPTDPVLWAEMPLAVGGKDIPEVPLSLRAGIKLTGMVQFNGSAERPAADRLPSVQIQLEPADPRPGINNARGRIETTGQIQTMGVPPGRYFVRVMGGYQNWSLQSVMVGGRDASVVPIDFTGNDITGAVLTFTDRPTKLVGQVTIESGTSGVAVLVFPADPTAWVGYGSTTRRMANTRADKDGKFEVSNLPAGDYFAVAITDKIANDWQNPKFLEALTSEASRIRIQDSSTATVNLKVVK